MSTSKADVKIEDEYVHKSKENFLNWSQELQTHTDKYLSILEDIYSEAITDGETSIALKEFKSYADALKKLINETGTVSAGLCANYLYDVDKADEYLY